MPHKHAAAEIAAIEATDFAKVRTNEASTNAWASHLHGCRPLTLHASIDNGIFPIAETLITHPEGGGGGWGKSFQRRIMEQQWCSMLSFPDSTPSGRWNGEV